MDPDRERLEAALATLGVAYELLACDPALADTAEFCAAYGFALEDSANTIVVVGKADPRRYAACIVLAPHRLDVNRTVRNRLGTRKASFASADETRALTGMQIGGVTPFGLPGELPVWVDAAVMARSRIVLGGGSRSWKVIAPPAILLALPGVRGGRRSGDIGRRHGARRSTRTADKEPRSSALIGIPDRRPGRLERGSADAVGDVLGDARLGGRAGVLAGDRRQQLREHPTDRHRWRRLGRRRGLGGLPSQAAPRGPRDAGPAGDH